VKTRRFWKIVSLKTTFLFLAAAVLSVFALIWMGMRLVRQDRALEAQQIEEKRESAADRIITALDQTLANEERKLVDLPAEDIYLEEEDYLLILCDSEGLSAWPEKKLLFYPFLDLRNEAPTQPFLNAEKAEFQDNNYNRAIRLLRSLSLSNNPAIKAAAKIRLARNLRNSGQMDEALTTCSEIIDVASSDSVTISGIPVDLLARRMRCALLENLGRLDQLQVEALDLLRDLQGRKWFLDRASYIYYIDKTKEWLEEKLDSDFGPQALAEAVYWIWESWRSTEIGGEGLDGRQSLRFFDESVVVLWQETENGLAALIAGPLYQQVQWFDPLFQSAEFSSVNVSLKDEEGKLVYGEDLSEDIPYSSRASVVSGLPWDIHVVNANLDAELVQFVQRRRLMMTGMAILALLVIAVSFLISRAVSRELAAARLQADFVSAVSHEFRTPLTSMRQFTEMLLEDDSLPPEKRSIFYQAQARATRRLSRLVESLLDFGRMEAGAKPYRLELLDIGQLARTVVQEFQLETGSENHVIVCKIPKESIQVKGDGEALTQALWNLLDNAVKYSEESQEVHVEIEAEHTVYIKVSDQGFGIPASERSRIFRKFIRGSNTKARDIKGTGIGLAVVKHIVDAHGGEIHVESEPGKGSTFTIQLPAGG
jgi:signal transduction histidine kinase